MVSIDDAETVRADCVERQAACARSQSDDTGAAPVDAHSHRRAGEDDCANAAAAHRDEVANADAVAACDRDESADATAATTVARDIVETVDASSGASDRDTNTCANATTTGRNETSAVGAAFSIDEAADGGSARDRAIGAGAAAEPRNLDAASDEPIDRGASRA